MKPITRFLSPAFAATRRCCVVLPLAFGLGVAAASPWPKIDQAIAQHAWPQAGALLAEQLAQHPRDARLRLLHGLVQAESGQLPAAQATLSQLADDHPELSEAHNNLGIVLARQGQLEAATRAFERARLADPNNAAAAQNLAKAQALADAATTAGSK